MPTILLEPLFLMNVEQAAFIHTDANLELLADAIVAAITGFFLDGGPIGLVRDGDEVVLDMAARTLDLKVDDDELGRRRAAWSAPAPKHSRGVLAKYAKLVGTAARGAVCD